MSNLVKVILLAALAWAAIIVVLLLILSAVNADEPEPYVFQPIERPYVRYPQGWPVGPVHFHDTHNPSEPEDSE